MEFDFIKFESTHARIEDRITVTKSGAIGFPTKFYEDNKIANFKFVVLYYDVNKMAIGVLFTNNESEKNRFSIIHSKKGYGGSVAVRSFFKVSKLDPVTYYGRYEWQKIQHEGVGELYVIKLKEREKKEL